MNKKTSNYIGLCAGILLTLTILYANDNYKIGSTHSRADFITYDIKGTIVYNVFCIERRGYCPTNALSGYSFWYILLTIGFLLSWKYRAKLGGIILKIAKKIHDKT